MVDVSPPWFPGEALSGASYSAMELGADNARVFMLDQRELPGREFYVTLSTSEQVAEAIRAMVVRGAPAIGISAAYGMVLAAWEHRDKRGEELSRHLRQAGERLLASRPTAVNLAWAVRQFLEVDVSGDVGEGLVERFAKMARAIHVDDVEACRRMGRIGAGRIPDGATILTHCNAGALATGGYGTALGVIRGCVEAGKRVRVLADETRPYLQGARLTAWELAKDGVPVEVITDNMAAFFMRRGEVSAIVVGADRIARNGDVANKIGTYGVACLAKHHGIPFYVAAPWSTVDLATESGDSIVIEERSREEVVRVGGAVLVPEGVPARHPAFDVTPAELVTAVFTERGEFRAGEIASGQVAGR